VTGRPTKTRESTPGLGGGERRQDAETQAMTLRIPREEYEALRTFCFVTHAASVNDVVLRAIRDLLATKGRAEEIEALLKRTTERYQIALEKLADL
jgi:hypothetical protein